MLSEAACAQRGGCDAHAELWEAMEAGDPIVVLDACGLVLITQPAFLFGGDGGSSSATSDASYLIGAASALGGAVIAGLLPVCTRISKECFWTAVRVKVGGFG